MSTPFKQTSALRRRVRDAIRTIPDFPKPGIQFKDISTLLARPGLMKEVTEWVWDSPPFPDVVVGLDARGFLFGIPVAMNLGIPFVMCRKAGKLPGKTVSHSYSLEYGKDTVEIQADAFPVGSKVLLIDDLLATGGTMEAAARLVNVLGGEVMSCVFVTELSDLGGRKRLEDLGYSVRSLVTYPEPDTP